MLAVEAVLNEILRHQRRYQVVGGFPARDPRADFVGRDIPRLERQPDKPATMCAKPIIKIVRCGEMAARPG